MTRREELSAFSARADELIDSKYILANVKIVNLLKSIAGSETLIAIFKSCLTDFDYYGAKEKYFVKSEINEDKGEFILPSSSRELLALAFSILMDIDAGSLDLGDFIGKYFYENGSIYESYAAFLKMLIKPFKVTVVNLMESVIAGKLQDPVEAVMLEEKKRKEAVEQEEAKAKKLQELSKKSYADSVNKIKKILVEDKKKIDGSSLANTEKEDITLIIETLANVIEAGESDALSYAFAAYKYVCKSHPLKFRGRIKEIAEEIAKINNEKA